MKYLVFFLISLFLIFYPAASLKAEPLSKPQEAQLFIQANDEYQKQKFSEAAEKYETLVKNGLVNGHLYYNLGNSYSKLNNNGKAMLYFLKAKQLIPRDADLNSNIDFLTKRFVDKLNSSENSQIFKLIFFWYDQLNLEEYIITFLILWSLLFVFLIARRFIYGDLNRLGIISLSLLNIIFGISFIARLSDSMEQKAVVITQEANVKSSTDINSVTIFKIHEGTILKVTEKTDKWSKIELTKDKRGWIQDNSIENL